MNRRDALAAIGSMIAASDVAATASSRPTPVLDFMRDMVPYVHSQFSFDESELSDDEIHLIAGRVLSLATDDTPVPRIPPWIRDGVVSKCIVQIGLRRRMKFGSDDEGFLSSDDTSMNAACQGVKKFWTAYLSRNK